jgi:2-polyprenyl-3-methyl-5-hydroxy-6-metoxy-1,4-benzoquinol methylase
MPLNFYDQKTIPERNRLKPVPLSREELVAFISKYPWYQTIDFGGGIVAKGSLSDAAHVDLVLPSDMRGMRYCDVGSNQGLYVMSAAMKGADAFGIDKQNKQWTMAETIAKHFGIRVKYFKIDIFDAPIKCPEYNKGFDLISMLSVFHHFRKPLFALRIVRGMCKGVLMGEFCCFSEKEKRWNKADELPEDWGENYHKTYPTKEAIVRALKKHFSRVEIIGPLKAQHRFLIRSEI